MRDYSAIYESKKRTVEEALALIENNDIIVTGSCATEPSTILGGLHTLKGKNGVEHLELLYTLATGDYEFFKEKYKGFVTVESFFYGPANRKLHKERACSYVPANLHASAARRDSYKKPNVFIVSVTTMDEHGYFRTSLSNMCERYYFDTVDKIIVEVNPNLPLINGSTEVHVSDVSCIIEVNTPIPIMPFSEPSEEDIAIGRHIASLVHNGDTIQLGFGGIPNAVASALMDKKDLGIHTEMINSGMARLIEAGVVTNKKKTLLRGKTVGAFAFGDQILYDCLHNNPSVLMLPSHYVNNPAVVAQNDNMVAINTAIQIDLTGQVASEGIGTWHYSGTGGQTDMSMGANHSKGGALYYCIAFHGKGR